MLDALRHEYEVIVCECGHTALEHHGVDTHPRHGGCHGNGSGHPWSSHKKCGCTLTSVMVAERKD